MTPFVRAIRWINAPFDIPPEIPPPVQTVFSFA